VDDNSIAFKWIRAFWHATLCSSVDNYCHFGGTCCHCQPLTSKVGGCFEAMVPELPNRTELHPSTHSLDNLTSRDLK
jgi:hypothetical protein